MDHLVSSELKPIIHSKRANLYYIEHCRVLQKEGRVVFLSPRQRGSQYFNIPIANTSVLLLGSGTSVTQAAMRMLSQAGVLVGFCGGGATPLFSATEVEWMTPQNEYRPTEYVQHWLGFWFDPDKRLEAARILQHARIAFVERVWSSDRELDEAGVSLDHLNVRTIFSATRDSLQRASSIQELLSVEAHVTKRLYKVVTQAVGVSGFVRDRTAVDLSNSFLNHGNYLAYGLAASVLWVLGIPHGFAVMHGKTRRGALVFDVADLVKDALVLPWAFICASEDYGEQGFRDRCLQSFTDHRATDFMFNTVKDLSQRYNSPT